MPVVKVSNEAYKVLLQRQAEDGNSMSIVMDRLLAATGTTARSRPSGAPVPPPAKLKQTNRKPLKKQYRCKFCGMEILNEGALWMHTKAKHPDRCPVDRTFPLWKTIIAESKISS
jgi:hypothetical protein